MVRYDITLICSLLLKTLLLIFRTNMMKECGEWCDTSWHNPTTHATKKKIFKKLWKNKTIFPSCKLTYIVYASFCSSNNKVVFCWIKLLIVYINSLKAKQVIRLIIKTYPSRFFLLHIFRCQFYKCCSEGK